MAPTGSRRPGHSRRAQYGTFLNYSLAVAGAAAGGALLLVVASDATAFSGRMRQVLPGNGFRAGRICRRG